MYALANLDNVFLKTCDMLFIISIYIKFELDFVRIISCQKGISVITLLIF